ncbi:uncharacterized protein EHS24_002958 [Apiotrichum porosum]|uniref:Uncharacterized protein n=1 Tax=Apiotrichum porosum TaxID=105984 RepID=A0A427XGJ4_9TREE|nr:uncharacterized protein EHS24_002958 [Apiotrichum porosum]RSH77887.1 hypothetical protein EHS24_002958 [Apiotrichum porosum]
MSAPSDFPDLPSELGMDAATLARQQRRDAVRRRVRASVPPIPELRFEQAYLRSVMPALHARKGDLLLGAPGAIEAGREVDVNWRAVAWITLKDQVISPLIQGVFWGLLSIAGAGVLTSMRAGLGMPTRTTAAPGQMRDGGAQSWRKFAQSPVGAAEVATVGTVI